MRERVTLALIAALALSACASSAPPPEISIESLPAPTSMAMMASSSNESNVSEAEPGPLEQKPAPLEADSVLGQMVTDQPAPLDPSVIQPLSGDGLAALRTAQAIWEANGPDTYVLHLSTECSMPCVQAEPVTQAVAVPQFTATGTNAEVLFPEATSVERLFEALASGSLAGPGRLAAVTYHETLGYPSYIDLFGPDSATITWQLAVTY